MDRAGVTDKRLRAVPDKPVELVREAAFHEAEARRPLADRVYLKEVAEFDGADDGRFLTHVLSSLADEVQVMMMQQGGHSRELALTFTKLQEAEWWALEHGRKTGSLVIVDRRVFKLPEGDK